MIIERDNEDIIIRISAPVNMKSAQKVIDYFNLVESISKNQGTEEDATALAREFHKEWWKENRQRFIR